MVFYIIETECGSASLFVLTPTRELLVGGRQGSCTKSTLGAGVE